MCDENGWSYVSRWTVFVLSLFRFLLLSDAMCRWCHCRKSGQLMSVFLNLTYSFISDMLAWHTHPFNGPLSGTTQVSQYQKGKTNLDFTEARDSEWQWHQLGHMQICTLFQTNNHASTPALSFFTGRMPFLPPNQQRQSTEGTVSMNEVKFFLNERIL